MAFASGWASGLNAYATVFVLGLLGRFTDASQVPAGFERIDVLVIMGVLALLELVADKIPYLDSTWDAISTVIRPIAGGVIGALIAGQTGSTTAIVTSSTVGFLTALLSHLSKSGIRLAINTSPEPVSNVTASRANDASLVGILTLAVAHPVPAAIIVAVILVVGLVLCLLLLAQIRRGLRALRRPRHATDEL